MYDITSEIPIVVAFYTQNWTEHFRRNNIKYFEHLSLNIVLYLYCFQFVFPENNIFLGYVNIKYVIRYKAEEEEKKKRNYVIPITCALLVTLNFG